LETRFQLPDTLAQLFNECRLLRNLFTTIA